MNERIQELMKQSMVEYQFDMRFSPEKFAELIVRECKQVLLDMINEGQGEFDTLDQALTEINEHFGVEE